MNYELETIAEIVLEDHFHLLYGVDSSKIPQSIMNTYSTKDTNSSDIFSRFARFCLGQVLRRYTKYYNRKYCLHNQIFNYNSKKIKSVVDATDLENKIVYIHSNPCKKDLCAEQHEYIHSSYPYYLEQLYSKNLLSNKLTNELKTYNLDLFNFYVERQIISKQIRFGKISSLYKNKDTSNEEMFVLRHKNYLSGYKNPLIPASNLLSPEIPKFSLIPEYSEVLHEILTKAYVKVKIQDKKVMLQFSINSKSINKIPFKNTHGRLLTSIIMTQFSLYFECFEPKIQITCDNCNSIQTYDSITSEFVLFLIQNYPDSMSSLVKALYSVEKITRKSISEVLQISVSSIYRILR